MKIFGKDLDREVCIVAEVGVNHEGDEATAGRLIELAAGAGADAVKLQTYTPERFVAANDAARLARVRRFGLDEAAHRRLKAVAEKAGIPLFSTAVTEDVVPLLAELFPVIKIASGDLDFEPVIRAAAATGKPVIVSTGLGTAEEVDRMVGWVRAETGADALKERLALMQCVSAYPAPVEEANVLSIPYLAARTGLTVGYSNHVIGPEACYAAVAQGATLIEVHFTDRKSGRDFRDHALSMEPADLRALVETLPRIRASLGSAGKQRMPAELGNLAAVRKGVVAARDLAEGQVLTRDDLMYARPASEFAAADLPSLVGRRLLRAVPAGHLVPRDGVSGA
ncbi:MAG: N-acetylneuraminate synthase family protein [Alphaproteobacteria bacterium]